MERWKLWLDQIMLQISNTRLTWIGIVEILIIAVFAYQLVLWIKNTKAWMLLRGIIVIVAFILLAQIFRMTTILYLVEVSVNVLAVAAVVVFQPEIRRALENLGQRKLLPAITPFDNKDTVRCSLETVEGIVSACHSMGKVKTGALIVMEKDVKLAEYEATGIAMDCFVSYQVLVNIFEHNTPLHDGAIIIRANRILAATCYLPLSDNNDLSKDMGTRHRAAVGMSEASDAIVIAVSEETGAISIAESGRIKRNVTAEELREELMKFRTIKKEQEKTPFYKTLLKGGKKHEAKNTK